MAENVALLRNDMSYDSIALFSNIRCNEEQSRIYPPIVRFPALFSFWSLLYSRKV